MSTTTGTDGARAGETTKDPRDAVFVESEELPSETPTVHGYDFNNGVDYKNMFESFLHHGFQVCPAESV